MYKINKKNYDIVIFNIYIYMLIFNIVNREFVFLFDIRYIILILALFLIINKITKGKIKINFINKKTLILFILFYFFMNISNIMLIFNNLNTNKVDFYHLIILHLFNFINIVALYLNSSLFNTKILLNSFKFSILFLSISILALLLGGTLPFLEFNGIVCGGSHFNMFGQNCRYSGYLIDPNYVTLIAIVFFVTILKYEKNLYKKIFYSILSIILVMLSFSKTIMVMLVPVLICLFILKKINNEKIYKYALITIILGIFITPFLMYWLNIFGNLSTMELRYYMWKSAISLFLKSPIIGSGISSARGYLSIVGNWYIHCHSTIMQLISEQGLISLILYGMIIYNIISQKKPFLTFIVLLYVAWGVTYETLYLNFTILFFAIYPILVIKDGKSETINLKSIKKDLMNIKKKLVLINNN